MIKKLIIMLFVIVCVSSGAFAIFSEYTTPIIDNNTTDTNVNMDSSVGNVKDVSFLQSFSGSDDYWQYSYGFIKNVDGELRHYINTHGVYYLESDGLVDMYIQCVECGGFIPIGPITNPLPKVAICHYYDAYGRIGSDYPKKYIYSRDEAYHMWADDYGKIVFDDLHFNPDIYSKPSEHAHTLFCNDCGGQVLLKNYDAFKIYNSYFADILNTCYASLPVDLCCHYNGSLDLFNASVDDFHPGWFKSMDKYNWWLEEASQDLDNSSNSDDGDVYHGPPRDPVVVVVLEEENFTDMSDGYVEEMVDISDENSTVA